MTAVMTRLVPLGLVPLENEDGHVSERGAEAISALVKLSL